jgi:hypothetical protein
VEWEFHRVACPTPLVCYAATQTLSNKAAAIAESNDGGLTWTISGHIPEANGGTHQQWFGVSSFQHQEWLGGIRVRQPGGRAPRCLERFWLDVRNASSENYLSKLIAA